MVKQRPDIGAAVSASPAGKLGLEIGQPDIIVPTASLDHDRMRIVIIAAIDDEPGRAGLPHFSDRDFLFAWHPALYHEQKAKCRVALVLRGVVCSRL